MNNNSSSNTTTTTIKRWHEAYQKALTQSPTRSKNGAVRIFERLVGSPPLPEEQRAYEIFCRLLMDLREMEDFEQRYQTAMVAFGGARLRSDDPYYYLAVELGEILAREGFHVRTGAGPGIMDAVPSGFKEELKRSQSSMIDRPTQGIRIELPFEQAISPSIDIVTMMKTFAIRRTALIWNARGIAVFPGGLGTVNELFEAWRAAVNQKVNCPIVILPTEFYSSFLDAIEQSAVIRRKLILASDFRLVQKAHNPAEAKHLLMQHLREKELGTQLTLREKLIYLRHELARGLTTISKLPPAVVFVGSKRFLNRTDPEILFIKELVKSIAATSSPPGVRVGVRGLVDTSVTEAVREVSRCSKITKPMVQRVLISEGGDEFEHVDACFKSAVAHREVLIHNATAAFFLPGDIPTLDILFALVCEIQTRRRKRIPVFLIGSEFWQPIVDGLRESLRGEYDGQFIKYSDMELVTVIDTTPNDLEIAMAAIHNGESNCQRRNDS